MDRWLKSALDYVPDWLEFQMRAFERPGCIVAIAERGTIVYHQAFGFADAVRGQPLTPRHRFRIASHSKAFTAAGILRLREQNRLRLDDRVGLRVPGDVALVQRDRHPLSRCRSARRRSSAPQRAPRRRRERRLRGPSR